MDSNIFQATPPPPSLSYTTIGNKVSPSILLIIVILAIIFFISGLLHLLIRYLLRPPNRESENVENFTAFQGQLQQLFHLHDSGVDQCFIDTLPVFLYKAIIGIKDPFDCAVCLCEFESHDKLRLLPKCSHAFHIECIDTWLLSHSTCPLCRSSLLDDFSPSPLVLVQESGSESIREIGSSYRVDCVQNDDLGLSNIEHSKKIVEVDEKDDRLKVIQVKLGKFRNVNVGVGEGEGEGSSNLYERRCFSMGSFEYVMNENSLLQVAIKPASKKPSRTRHAMSECDCHSKREGFKDFDSKKSSNSARISANKRESFSISKIWLRSRKSDEMSENSSRRALSFRFPLHHDSTKARSRLNSEFEEIDLDVEVGSCQNSMGSQIDETPSFARRTLLWIVGKENRVDSHV